MFYPPEVVCVKPQRISQTLTSRQLVGKNVLNVSHSINYQQQAI
jgi:hypothetical protein